MIRANSAAGLLGQDAFVEALAPCKGSSRCSNSLTVEYAKVMAFGAQFRDMCITA